MFCFDYISHLRYLIPKSTFWRSLKKCKKNQFFWHIFSSNCCQYWKIEFRCLVYPKTFIFYPKKMKTSERKQFWKIQNCAPLEALWGIPPKWMISVIALYQNPDILTTLRVLGNPCSAASIYSPLLGNPQCNEAPARLSLLLLLFGYLCHSRDTREML